MNITEFRNIIEANFSPELASACRAKLETMQSAGIDIVDDPLELLEEIEIDAFDVNADSEKIMCTALRM